MINIFIGNTRGIVAYSKLGKQRFKIGRNSFWNNEDHSIDMALPKESLFANPNLEDATNGQFAVESTDIREARQGLTDPAIFEKLWQRWVEIRR